MKNLLITVMLVSMLSLITSCSLSEEKEVLRGSWVFIETPPYTSFAKHNTIRFLKSNEYQVLNKSGDIFEKGKLFNITDHSFEYTIIQLSIAPEQVGSQNYADYSIDGNKLTMIFWYDSTKQISFGTYVAKRPSFMTKLIRLFSF